MNSESNKEIIERLWRHFAASEWEAAGELFADDLVVEWVHTGEVFLGRENFLNVQRFYPVSWRIELRRFVADGDLVVAEIAVPHEAGVSRVSSWAELRDGKIFKLTEYWVDAESEERPVWRAQWTAQQ